MSRPPEAVTFDCWSTLIYERDPRAPHARRVDMLVEVVRGSGAAVSPEAAREALTRAWSRHIELWTEGIASGSPEIAAWALADLGIRDVATVARLGEEFSHAVLHESGILALEQARETLERLAAAGVRRALVCDTGFSPGRVVRRLLDDVGLLELLEVHVFSDEAGVPKPHRRVFEAALGGLGVEADRAVHVGDLRRTDIAGGRGAGMRTVRIRHHHDDTSDLPEGDQVADSHAHLRELLGV